MVQLGHDALAREYLAQELGADAPQGLTVLKEFHESPLEGEGTVTVFSFEASVGGAAPQGYYAVAGETIPNYYPAYGLSPDDVYSLHLGTRFMLVLEVGMLPLEQLPAGTQADLIEDISRVAPGEPVSDFEMVAAFGVEDQKHAVARCSIGGDLVYVLGGDLPLGIYREIHLPPQVIYRLHIGNVIRLEEPPEEA